MKIITLVFLMFSVCGLVAQSSRCKDMPTECERMLCEGNRLAMDKKFQKAIYKYTAAKTCDEQMTLRVNDGILNVYKLIEGERIRADKQTKIAQQQTRTALANDLAYKAQNLLDEGDRTKAFQLAAFAHRYIDYDNHQATRVLHNAYYYNDHPNRQDNSNLQKSWNRNFIGHSKGVNAANFSPDGQYVITGSADSTAKLWEVSTGKEIRTFQGYRVAHVANFSSDGQYIITQGPGGNVLLYEISTGNLIRVFQGHRGAINSANFSPDGQHIITGGWDGNANLWEVSTGNLIRTFRGSNSAVNSANFSPDGQYIITGSADNTAKLWEVSTGNLIRTFQGHSYQVTAANFSPDGQYIITGSADYTAKLWEVSTGKEIHSFQGHSYDVTSAKFSPDGQYIITGSVDHTAKLWEIRRRKEIRSFQGHTRTITAVNFSPDGQHIITGSWDGTAKLWKVNTGKEIHSFQGHSNDVTAANFSPDGQYIITGSADRTAKRWIIDNNKLITAPHFLSHFTPEDIKVFNLFEILLQIKQWEAFLKKSDPQQILAMGRYLHEQVENNNNPDLFKGLYNQVVQCYQIVVINSGYSIYQDELVKIYQEWSEKLTKNDQIAEAKQKLILAQELLQSPEHSVQLEIIQQQLQQNEKIKNK